MAIAVVGAIGIGMGTHAAYAQCKGVNPGAGGHNGVGAGGVNGPNGGTPNPADTCNHNDNRGGNGKDAQGDISSNFRG